MTVDRVVHDIAFQCPALDAVEPDAQRGGVREEGPGHGIDLRRQRSDSHPRSAMLHGHRSQPGFQGTCVFDGCDHRGVEPGIEIVNRGLHHVQPRVVVDGPGQNAQHVRSLGVIAPPGTHPDAADCQSGLWTPLVGEYLQQGRRPVGVQPRGPRTTAKGRYTTQKLRNGWAGHAEDPCWVSTVPDPHTPATPRCARAPAGRPACTLATMSAMASSAPTSWKWI